MKAKKFNKKLTLSKVSVANLNIESMPKAKGGALTFHITCGMLCDTYFTCGDETYCGDACKSETFCIQTTCPPC